jgi:hypothetical protein
MDISSIGAFRTYRYLTTLAQGGDRNQALLQALAAGQPQAAEVADVLDSATDGKSRAVSPLASLASLAGQAGGEALGALAYTASAATGQGPEALASLLATLGGGNTSLLFPSAALPLPAATALAAYGYGQSENPQQALAQLTATGRKALLATGLDLLA